ncbi:MAG: GNAT family N-acetyltransferase [Blastocatellia bacterium]|nr:GNAT family N-acetyltransferase [Blastocatellia bacterium]
MEYRVRHLLTSEELNALFTNVWNEHKEANLGGVIERSLTYVCAYEGEKLVGYVNVAWDGGEHAFLLDTAVDRMFRHKGIGTELVRQAIDDVRSRGLKWLHVDYEPHLEKFYRGIGFRHTAAGLIRLRD